MKLRKHWGRLARWFTQSRRRNTRIPYLLHSMMAFNGPNRHWPKEER